MDFGNTGWRLLLAVAALAALSGCQPEAANPGPSPCADGGWGLVTDPGAAVHVAAGGDDGAAGTQDDPVSTLATALDLARAGDLHAVFLGPGDYPDTSVTLSADDGDDTLVVQGCPAGTALLQDLAVSPVLGIAEAQGVKVAGLSLHGGYHGLGIWNGASAELKDVEVEGATDAGVVIDGVFTVVSATGLVITDPLPGEGGANGYGLVSRYAQLDLGDLTISGATTAGAVIIGYSSDTTEISLENVAISGTNANGGSRVGRGLHLQGAMRATVTGATLTDNHDAGLFCRQVPSFTGTDIAVDGVGPGAGDGGGATGDGMVFSGYDPDHPDSEAGMFQVSLQGTSVTGEIARVGLLFDLAQVSLNGTDVSGGTLDIYAQNESEVVDSDAEVEVGEALDLYRTTLDVDAIVAGR